MNGQMLLYMINNFVQIMADGQLIHILNCKNIAIILLNRLIQFIWLAEIIVSSMHVMLLLCLYCCC